MPLSDDVSLSQLGELGQRPPRNITQSYSVVGLSDSRPSVMRTQSWLPDLLQLNRLRHKPALHSVSMTLVSPSESASFLTFDEESDLDESDDVRLTKHIWKQMLSGSVVEYGKLRFKFGTTNDVSSQYHPYIVVEKETHCNELPSCLQWMWKLDEPKVIVNVISNPDYFEPWADTNNAEDLQIGLMQAARLTKMWIVTDGTNSGISAMIGEAVSQERIRRKLLDSERENMEYATEEKMPKLTFFGIACLEDLPYGENVFGPGGSSRHKKSIVVNNLGFRNELNPCCSQFILLRTGEKDNPSMLKTTAFNLESKVLRCLAHSVADSSTTVNQKSSDTDSEETTTPMVGLLLQGGPKEIDRVLWLLKRQIPIVVVKEIGYASGLLAYAFHEGMKGRDSHHINEIVRPQLMLQVKEAFNEDFGDDPQACMHCRDQLLECVKYSVQNNSRLLTIMDPSKSNVDFKDLSKYILMALHSSNTAILRERIHWSLRLALDWNSPEFAASKLLDRMEHANYRVKDSHFLDALLLPGREPFVELILMTGFSLRRFLTVSRTLYIYKKSLKNEFFATVCLKQILGMREPALSMQFFKPVDSNLNTLLCSVSGLHSLVDLTFKSEYHLASTTGEKSKAERQAIMELIYWAVLNNNRKLAEVLWRRCAEPIAVALVISNMFYRFYKHYVTDVDLKIRMKQQAIEFGKLAISVMDVTYKNSNVMALQTLTRCIEEFNGLTVLDLALIGNNKFFIAHPCCQQSVRERWHGMMTIQQSSLVRYNLHEGIKIFLCVTLVFPIYLWLSFDRQQATWSHDNGSPAGQDEDEEQSVGTSKDSMSSGSSKSQGKSQTPREGVNKKNGILQRLNNRRREIVVIWGGVPLWMKLYYLWTAPITKFWVNQYFYIVYLFLYAYALTLPFCGFALLYRILAAWTLCSCMDSIVRAVKWKRKFPMAPLFWQIRDITVDFLLTAVFVWGSLGTVPEDFFYLDYKSAKSLLALALLYHFYRAVRHLFPVSQALGPMMVNIMNLLNHTMIDWFKLWMMCLLSGAFAIHMVLYPAKPLTWSVVFHSLKRAALGLWLSDIDDLFGDRTCSQLYHYQEVSDTCNAYVLSRVESCPLQSLFGHLVVIQFLLISRLVFYTLMFSMFSATIAKTTVRAEEIWKYQFYVLMTDYESRSVIPAPLTVLSYPFYILFFIGTLPYKLYLNCIACLGITPKKTSADIIPYTQWKSYLSTMEKQDEKKFDLNEVAGILEDELAVQQTTIKRLSDRIVHVENNQTTTALMLENVLTELEKLDPRKQARQTIGQNFIHSASRKSPYPGTTIERFPVLAISVPWDEKYETYDPVIYTKPISDMPVYLAQWADPEQLDYFRRRPTTVEFVDQAEEADNIAVRGLESKPVFNTEQMVTLNNGQQFFIDRRSYIIVQGQTLEYELDALGVPRNPMGRTGVRGRGKLLRWGPNHSICAVISRWRPMTPSTGHKLVMEVMVIGNPSKRDNMSLPGDFVYRDRSPYSAMCEAMFEQVFREQVPADISKDLDVDDMIKFFSQFTSQTYEPRRPALYANYGYSAFQVYKGYMDDKANTDNAWVEAEVWNFHYKYKDYFDSRTKNNDLVVWTSASDHMPLTMSEIMAVSEAAKIHSAHF